MAKRTRKPNHQDHISKPKFEPRNAEQEIAWKIINANTISFLTGPAGTAKTYLAAHLAVDSVLNNRCESIYLSRPAVDAGEDMGYLPGNAEEKLAIFLEPLYSNIRKITGVKNLHSQEVFSSIRVAPVGKIRGYTFEDSVCLLDEAQNMTLNQIRLYLTRIGEGTKMVICGDTDQMDILSSKLYQVASSLTEIDHIGWYHFSDNAIVRHPLIQSMLDKLKVIG